MSTIKVDVVLTASGEKRTGKTFLLNKIRKAAEGQPQIAVIEDHLDGHEIHIVGDWEVRNESE